MALIMIAHALVSSKPSRAGRLVDDALRIAEGLDDHTRAEMMAEIVEYLAEVDLGLAERAAHHIADHNVKAKLLAGLGAPRTE